MDHTHPETGATPSVVGETQVRAAARFPSTPMRVAAVRNREDAHGETGNLVAAVKMQNGAPP